MGQPATGTDAMLKIEKLSVDFSLRNGETGKALRQADLEISPGETLALIGESGSGKSVLGLAIISLLPQAARIQGKISFKGNNLLGMGEEQMVGIRGSQIAFIPQSAGLSLNPTMKVMDQVAEAVPASKNNGAGHLALNLLTRFGLGREKACCYPHQLSGGMRQRTLVAIGLATRPSLLIADEPTKGIDHQRIKDVESIFLQVKQNNPGLAVLLVTHDLNLAASMADRVSVMYAGRVIETSRCQDFFRRPKHPYSQALLAAAPERGLKPIPGQAPGIEEEYDGCPFAPRCQYAQDRCRIDFPNPTVAENETVLCWRYAQA